MNSLMNNTKNSYNTKNSLKIVYQPKKIFCLLCISLVLTIFLIAISGCKSQQATEKGAAAESSEEAEISNTLQEIDELDSMEKDLDEDMGLSEIEQMGYD